MPTLLTSRQEAFCRHYAVSGNAAGAARAAGYSEKCARQQGYENLQKPFVLIRLDEIRRGFAETAGREAAILLSRLEQVWPLAVENANVHAMLMTIGIEAKLSGLTGPADTKVRLWGPDGQAGPLERAVERAGDGAALAAAEAAAPRDATRARRRNAPAGRVFEDELEPDGVVADEEFGAGGVNDPGWGDDGANDRGWDDDGALWHADGHAGDEADEAAPAFVDGEAGTTDPDIASGRPPVRRRTEPPTDRRAGTKGPHFRPRFPEGRGGRDGDPTEADMRARVAA